MNELPPAMLFAQKFCGGVWKLSGSSIQAELRFESLQDGEIIEGHGTVMAQGSTLHLFTRFGWDPIVKKVFYFDMHNNDTVYFGHASIENGLWVNEFSTLVGPPAKFVQEAAMPGTHLLDSHLYVVRENGSKDLIEHMIFHRHLDG